MARRKAAINVKIDPWLSARRDCTEGRFRQIGNSLLLSHKVDGEERNPFINLSSGAKHLYLCMTMEAELRQREFVFPKSAAKKYGIANSSLRRYIDELIEARMIERQSGKTARLPNLYRFCLDWKRQQ